MPCRIRLLHMTKKKCNALMIRYNDLRGIQSIMAKRLGRQSRIAINYFRRHMCGSLRQEASPLSKPNTFFSLMPEHNFIHFTATSPIMLFRVG